MKIKFLGAAGTVTGSKYLLSTNDAKYLVDCGLFQGLKDLRLRNWRKLEVEAFEIDAVFLTHAHIDHTGYLPRLVALGFDGPIYCSRGTYELSKILLPDSGYLQEEEAHYANKKGYSKHKPALPLYTREEAEESLKYFRPIDFHVPTKVEGGAQITFSRAGHILGASCLLLEAQNRKIIFSGDVGRYHDLIMKPPEPLPDADYLVVESTYGDRLHASTDITDRMAAVINEVAKNKGTIVIPAFAVGRAQTILLILEELKKAKKIPDIKTYLDSPMAINATNLYCAFSDEHRLSKEKCQEICGSATLTLSAEESKAINDVPGPKIIISASGMASGGRIVHHLAQYISDPNNAIILVGYQAAGTRGRALQDGISELRIFNQEYAVKAQIKSFSDLSAHGDYEELVRWLKESKLRNPKVFVTHGEQKAAEAFCQLLINTFHWQVEVPKDESEYDL